MEALYLLNINNALKLKNKIFIQIKKIHGSLGKVVVRRHFEFI